MDAEIKLLIDNAKSTALSNGMVDRSTLKKLLELKPGSEECEYLGKASREVMIKHTGGYVRIGSSIGVDIAPCPMNCQFCSLGEEWGLVTETHILTDDQILILAKSVVDKGFTQITLRTTEYFSHQKLCQLGRKIRAAIPGDYMLTANTGEVTTKMADELFYSGFTGMYHTLRLREGIDTPFDPQTRIDSINSIQDSKLMHTVGIEPIGSEHTDDEILDMIENFRNLDLVSVCIMKRVNVAGTPLSRYAEISDDRFAQIVAVARIAGGLRWGVATHPVIPKTLEYGANHITVETGANPRDDLQQIECWEPYNHQEAMKLIIDSGLKLGQASRDGLYERISLKTGDSVPKIRSESTHGRFDLSERIRNGPVMLYFYPQEYRHISQEYEKDLNRHFDDFVKRNIALVCINDESVESHKTLVKNIDSRYEHISDTDMKIAKDYESYIIRDSSEDSIGKTNRELFLIDTDAKLKYHWRARLADETIPVDCLISQIDEALRL